MLFFLVWLFTYYKVYGRVFFLFFVSVLDGGLFCEVDLGIWGVGNVRLVLGK